MFLSLQCGLYVKWGQYLTDTNISSAYLPCQVHLCLKLHMRLGDGTIELLVMHFVQICLHSAQVLGGWLFILLDFGPYGIVFMIVLL
jgi:hypothetical protein